MTHEAAGDLTAAGPIGVIAAGGPLPIQLAEAAVASGRGAHIVAIDGIASPDVARFPHTLVSLGQVNAILVSLRRAGCRDLVIAGAMQRPNLWKIRIDWGFVRHLRVVRSLTKGGDDSVLRRVVRFFEIQGFRVLGVPDVAPHLLVPEGTLGQHAPQPAHEAGMARALALIGDLGRFDVGQAVVATADRIVAVEGVRGTDAMLRDLAGHAGVLGEMASRAVLVKRAKPGQEMRVDLPTIGPETVARVTAAGLAGIAVGAGETIALERAEVRRRADAAGVFVTAMAGLPPAAGATTARESGTAAVIERPLIVQSRAAPTPSDRRDIGLGFQVLPVLRAHAAGVAAVIAGQHILAVSGSLPIPHVVASLGRRSHWGQRVLKRRIGTLVIDLGAVSDVAAANAVLGLETFKAVLDAGLAGICCIGGPLPESARETAIAWANDGRLFLMSEASS